MRRAIELAVLNCISYFGLTIDYRVVAQGNYGWSIATSAFLGFLAFTIIKRISESKSRIEEFGYVIGGIIGTLVGIYISKLILGR